MGPGGVVWDRGAPRLGAITLEVGGSCSCCRQPALCVLRVQCHETVGYTLQVPLRSAPHEMCIKMHFA